MALVTVVNREPVAKGAGRLHATKATPAPMEAPAAFFGFDAMRTSQNSPLHSQCQAERREHSHLSSRTSYPVRRGPVSLGLDIRITLCLVLGTTRPGGSSFATACLGNFGPYDVQHQKNLKLLADLSRISSPAGRCPPLGATTVLAQPYLGHDIFRSAKGTRRRRRPATISVQPICVQVPRLGAELGHIAGLLYASL